MLYPTDLLHTVANDRQRAARQRAAAWRAQRRPSAAVPSRVRRSELPRVALG
jgi:hypothetical protein